jgi:hypothetical protein
MQPPSGALSGGPLGLAPAFHANIKPAWKKLARVALQEACTLQLATPRYNLNHC